MTNIRDRIQEELVKPSPDDVDGMWTLIDELENKGWIYESGKISLTAGSSREQIYTTEQSIVAYCALAWMAYHIGYRNTEWVRRNELEEKAGGAWVVKSLEEENDKFRFVYQNAEQALEILNVTDD